MTAIETVEKVRAWAKGIYATEAGVELLVRSNKAIYDRAPHIIDHRESASIDVDMLLAESLPWSSGEKRLVRIAASLLDGRPVDMAEAVTGLGRPYLELVIAAIAHAGGSHEGQEVVRNGDGTVNLVRPGSLYPWP